MTWTPQMEFMARCSVAHAAECPDFRALPRVTEKKTRYGVITSCKHCETTLWTADELRKAGGTR